MSRATCVIADDHELVSCALATNIVPAAGMNVIATVGDAMAALQACQTHRPNLLLMDVIMPGRDALAMLADIRSASSQTRIVILSGYCRDVFIDMAVRAEVAGYLLKSERPALLISALQRILNGERVYSPSVEERLLQHNGSIRTRISQLTPREVEVLRYIGNGWDNSRMAHEMHLSKRTVERHVARLMNDLAIHDRTHLTRFAHEQGLVE